MSNVLLFRPCASDRGPVNAFGSYMYDRGPKWKGSRYHLGVDVPVSQGTPLYASGRGRVMAVSQTQRVGYIWTVTIDYPVEGVGTVRVSTQHHSRIDVHVGQDVTAVTRIGESGGAPGTLGAGNSNGPHVHIEVRVNGVLKNPDDYLNSRSQILGTIGVPIDLGGSMTLYFRYNGAVPEGAPTLVAVDPAQGVYRYPSRWEIAAIQNEVTAGRAIVNPLGSPEWEQTFGGMRLITDPTVVAGVDSAAVAAAARDGAAEAVAQITFPTKVSIPDGTLS